MDLSIVIIFYSLSILLGVSSFGFLISRCVCHYLAWALTIFLSVGGFFFMLNADFNAIIQIFLSILLIIFLFSVNLFFSKNNIKNNKVDIVKLLISVSCVVLFGVMVCVAMLNDYAQLSGRLIPPLNQSLSTVYVMAENGVLNHILAFLLIGICCLSLVVGLSCLLKKHRKEDYLEEE